VEDKIERIMDLQIAALSFINAIICGGPGKDLDFRIHIRFEFTMLGVDLVLDRLSQSEADYLDTQITIYTDHQESDEAELAKRFDVQNIETDKPESIFSAIYQNLKHTRSQIPFLSFLQETLLFPVNSIQKYVN
jgi:hypothetical protein